MRIKRNGLILGATVALALSGCATTPDQQENAAASTAEADQAKSAYEFKTPAYGAEGELTVTVPQDLIDVAPEASGLLVTSMTATAHELSSAKYCAMDLAFTYSDGAVDTMMKPKSIKDGPESGDVAKAEGPEAVAELQASYDEQYEAYLNAPGWENAIGHVAGSNTWNVEAQIEDFDAAAPELGIYSTEDGEGMTLVQDCAQSPMDDSTATTLKFPALGEDGPAKTRTYGFASVDMTVMKDGSLSIVESKIRDYVLDTGGNWLAE